MKQDDKPSAAPQWGRAEYGALLEAWPRDAAGQPEAPAFLTSCMGLDLADELLAGMLEAFGIPVLRRFPHDGAFGKLMLGQSGMGVDMYVPESMLEQAVGLMEHGDTDETAVGAVAGEEEAYDA